MTDRRNVGRRTFLKGVGAAAGTGAGLAATDRLEVGPPVQNAEAAIPLFIGGALIVGAAATLAYGHLTDDSGQATDVADSLDWQSHVDVYTQARENWVADDQHFASLKRDVQLVEERGREDAIYAVYKAALEELGTSAAKADAEDAIDEAIAVVENAIYERLTFRAEFAHQTRLMTGADTSLSSDTVLHFWDGTQTRGQAHAKFYNGGNPQHAYSGPVKEEPTLTLVNGNSITYSRLYEKKDAASNDANYTYWAEFTLEPGTAFAPEHQGSGDSFEGAVNEMVIKKPDPANYSGVSDGDEPDGDMYYTVYDTPAWKGLLDDLMDVRTTLKGETQSMVDTYYDAAQNDDEIDLVNMIGPKHLADTAKAAGDFEEAALALRSIGIPISDQTVAVEVENDSGELEEHEGRLGWSSGSGETLPVDKEIRPADTVGSIYIALNYTKEDGSLAGTTAELAKPFTITYTDPKVTDVSFTSRDLAKSDSTHEQVRTIMEENSQANDRAKEIVYETVFETEGGGGSSGPGLGQKIRDWARDRPAEAAGVAGGGGLMAYLYSQGGNV